MNIDSCNYTSRSYTGWSNNILFTIPFRVNEQNTCSVAVASMQRTTWRASWMWKSRRRRGGVRILARRSRCIQRIGIRRATTRRRRRQVYPVPKFFPDRELCDLFISGGCYVHQLQTLPSYSTGWLAGWIRSESQPSTEEQHRKIMMMLHT